MVPAFALVMHCGIWSSVLDWLNTSYCGQINTVHHASDIFIWKYIKAKKVYLVNPRCTPTLHARISFKLLIMLLFPTLGKPGEDGGQIVQYECLLTKNTSVREITNDFRVGLFCQQWFMLDKSLIISHLLQNHTKGDCGPHVNFLPTTPTLSIFSSSFTAAISLSVWRREVLPKQTAARLWSTLIATLCFFCCWKIVHEIKY